MFIEGNKIIMPIVYFVKYVPIWTVQIKLESHIKPLRVPQLKYILNTYLYRNYTLKFSLCVCVCACDKYDIAFEFELKC